MRMAKTLQNHDWLRRSATAALAVALAFAAGQSALAQSSGDLQAQVTSRLQQDAALSGARITATVSGGQITLNGSVLNEKQWQEAETATANTPGVRTIENNLVITGPANAGAQTGWAPPAPDMDGQGQAGQAETGQAGPGGAVDATAVSNGQVPPPPPPDSMDSQTAAPTQAANGDSYGAQGYGYGAQNDQPQRPGRGEYIPPEQPVSGPVTVPANTVLQIRTVEPLDSAQLLQGQIFDATAANDVYVGNVLAIPRGAQMEGKVVRLKKAGPLGGNTLLALKLTGLNMGGQFYPLDTDMWWNRGPNKAGYTAGNTIAGSAFGAVLGGLIGGGTGAAIGAGAGAVGGMGASAATNGPHVILPSETVLAFHLARPVTVQPVSWQEAQRLAASTPRLQQRPVYRRPYAQPYLYPYPNAYAYPYPYAYPPPYYGPSGVYLGWGWGW
ncbi:MAG TPA: BON domain-containing protein [Acidobacterium sp.]|uniref:Phospholipid-binding domain protein n=2 Tax=Acidobacteriaceae TaxID=204434 RepID=C1F431_ACIC5|nr:phospholipid-binding domain protein [Acidobacterium capsulatum ATCC 51196]HCT60290.1 BON domain-containing protein [Acidobacterium sp.]